MGKTTTLLTLALGMCASAFAQPVPDLLYYKFDGTGTSIPNLATNPPTGTATATIVGAQSQTSTGICSGSLLGTGAASSNDYVNTGWVPAHGNASFTISFWTSNIQPSSSLWYVFGEVNTAGWRIFTNGVAGPSNWIMRGAGLTDITATNGAVVAPTMTTFVYDAVALRCSAYVNGVLVNTSGQTAPNITGTSAAKVGGYNTTQFGLAPNGLMDEFRLYGRALSPAEVAQLYNPFPSGFLGADQTVCPGDTVTLFDYPLQSVTWSTGDTTTPLHVTSSGSYIMNGNNGCITGVDTVEVTVIAAPAPGFLGSDPVICTGDSALLAVTIPHDSLLWSTSATTDSIYVSQVGTYTVDLYDLCGVYTDTIEVLQSSLVYSGFAMGDTLVPCLGDTSYALVNGIYDSYIWSTGDTNASIMITAPGTYYVTVTDACGMGTDSVTTAFNTPATGSFSSTANLLAVSFTSTVSGTGPFSYVWAFGDGGSDVSANPSHTYGAAGTYVVTLIVSSVCGNLVLTDTITITDVAISDRADYGMSLQPNPARGSATLSAELPSTMDASLLITDLQGKVLETRALGSVSGRFQQRLDLSKLPAGMYLVHIRTEQGTATARLSVMQ